MDVNRNKSLVLQTFVFFEISRGLVDEEVQNIQEFLIRLVHDIAVKSSRC